LWTATIRSPIHRATGTATAFPTALYRGESGVLSPSMAVQSSGNPCNLSHSLGVNRLTVPNSSALCSIHRCRCVELLATSFLVDKVGANITPSNCLPLLLAVRLPCTFLSLASPLWFVLTPTATYVLLLGLSARLAWARRAWATSALPPMPTGMYVSCVWSCESPAFLALSA